MTTDERITRLEMQIANLQNAFLQSQRNLIPTTDKVYDTASKVTEITPWTATKTAYIEDTEVIFTDVPQGNLTVYFYGSYEVEREGSVVAIRFAPLDKVTEITISIV